MSEVDLRLLRVNIGDWSGVGHGKASTRFVQIVGDDLSDEALLESKQKVENETGILLTSICSDYEESEISIEAFEILKNHGFSPKKAVKDLVAVRDFFDDFDEYELFDALDLLMFYAGKNIKNFQWKELEPRVLVGGANSILDPCEQFGYGLFFN